MTFYDDFRTGLLRENCILPSVFCRRRMLSEVLVLYFYFLYYNRVCAVAKHSHGSITEVRLLRSAPDTLNRELPAATRKEL